MNNCPSYIDHVYYGKKYGLFFRDDGSAMTHYIKIGKQEGYFPNQETEKYFNKLVNFDKSYYEKKYKIHNDTKKHWENYGQKLGYFVNKCDELNYHECNCNCIDVHVVDHNIKRQLIDITDNMLTETHENISCCKSSDGTEICSCSECLNNEINIRRIDNQIISDIVESSNISTVEHNDGNTIYEYDKSIDSTFESNNHTVDFNNKHKRVIKHSTESSDCSCTECENKKNIRDETNCSCTECINNETVVHLSSECNCSDCISKNTNVSKNIKLFTKNEQPDDDSSVLNNNFDNDKQHTTESYCDCQDSECVKNRNIQSNKENSEQSNDLLVNSNNSLIYQAIEKNITNIQNYLSLCNNYIDAYLELMKNAYQCISDICNVDNNYIVYNSARVKLQTIMLEIDKFVMSSYYKKIPVFYKSDDKKKTPTFIKFPLFIQKTKELTGDEYFKIHFMKLSLKHLKLDNYKLTLLQQNDILTSKTSPLPPSNCPVGQVPDKNMYDNDSLIKYWDRNYHMSIFENALSRIVVEKEIIDNCINLLNIKCELFNKIQF